MWIKLLAREKICWCAARQWQIQTKSSNATIKNSLFGTFVLMIVWHLSSVTFSPMVGRERNALGISEECLAVGVTDATWARWGKWPRRVRRWKFKYLLSKYQTCQERKDFWTSQAPSQTVFRTVLNVEMCIAWAFLSPGLPRWSKMVAKPKTTYCYARFYS